MPLPPNAGPNGLVTNVWGGLGQARARPAAGAMPGSYGAAAGLPALVLFAGVLGNQVTRPGGADLWWILYLDWALQDWLLIEDEGAVHTQNITDPAISPLTRDLVWVEEDASVGLGSRAQTLEAQFLTGDFTRAADFEPPVGGGTTGASTGVFCEARTPSCCRIKSRS